MPGWKLGSKLIRYGGWLDFSGGEHRVSCKITINREHIKQQPLANLYIQRPEIGPEVENDFILVYYCY
jgi:hypothetical protein